MGGAERMLYRGYVFLGSSWWWGMWFPGQVEIDGKRIRISGIRAFELEVSEIQEIRWQDSLLGRGMRFVHEQKRCCRDIIFSAGKRNDEVLKTFLELGISVVDFAGRRHEVGGGEDA